MGIIVALLAHKNIQYIIIASNKAVVVEVAKVVATNANAISLLAL